MPKPQQPFHKKIKSFYLKLVNVTKAKELIKKEEAFSRTRSQKRDKMEMGGSGI